MGCKSVNDKNRRDNNNKKGALKGPAVKAPAKVTLSKEDLKQIEFEIHEDKTGQNFNKTIDSSKRIEELYSILNLNKFNEYDIQKKENSELIQVEPESVLGEVLKQHYGGKVPEKVNINLLYKGLDIPDSIDEVKKVYQEKSKIIGAAIFDNPDFFGIVTFIPEKERINKYLYDKKKNEKLTKFNPFSSYCNAGGYLYISGGEEEQESLDADNTVVKYNDFFRINLTNLEDEYNNNSNNLNLEPLQELSEARTWHSMIFVPNKYIFIVGGSRTKSVEIYDTETQQLSQDSQMNELHSEGTLILVNEAWLYVFYGFLLHQTYSETIERCNLRRGVRNWEKVNVDIKTGSKIQLSFFGVSYFKNNQILLIGGNDNAEEKNKSYIMKLGGDTDGMDEISEFEVEGNISCVYREKLFIPVDDYLAVNIPVIYGDELQVIKVNMNEGHIEAKNFNEGK